MHRSSPRLLSPSDRDDVVDVLVDAFRDYPVMHYVLAGGVAGGLRALISFYADKRLQNGWPVLGVHDDDGLVAVALVTPPLPGDPEVLVRLDGQLHHEIGADAYAKMLAFEAASDANEPVGRFHFVGMLGVRRRAQRRGHAGALLELVKQLAVDEGLDGVALSTEDEANLPFYHHVGFDVVAHRRVSLGGSSPRELDTWGLCWRPSTSP